MTDPLVVPVGVQALVVAAGTQTFRRWPFNYSALASFDSPEPRAGAGQSTFLPRPAGVYLHWDLPDALRHGTGDEQSGDIAYPLVPNRWLLVRLAGPTRAATAWVVESDCPNPDSPALYLVDDAILAAWSASGQADRVAAATSVRNSAQGGPLVAELGKAFPLATWSERAPHATFLTAVAPGNVLFSRYEPHCANVFTFYDDMTGVAAGDAVSYLVAGWYSDPAADVLAGTTADALGWSGAGTAQPSSSLYEGFALGLTWSPGAVPASPLPAMAGNVHAGVGNTTVDAFTALVAGQLGAGADVTLLQAFQYGLLPELAQVNGADLLARATHQASFGSKPGPTTWEIVPVSSDGTADTALTADEAAWLASLNSAQASLDTAQRSLEAHRWSLYALWWKWQLGQRQSIVVPPDGYDDDAYRTAVTTTLPALIAADAAAVLRYAAQVPQPVVQPGDTRQDSFQRGVAAFAAAKSLDAAKALRAVAGPRLWRSGDPVVVLSGVEPGPVPDPGAALPCRLPGALVTALTVSGTTIDATVAARVVPALPNAAALPATVAALLAELVLLDAAGAGAVAAAAGVAEAAVAAAMSDPAAARYTGTLPANDLSPWTRQPWSALLMEWQVAYVPIPHDTGGTPNWTFDGDDYVYDGPFGGFGSDTLAPIELLGGIAPLTPEAQFTFGGRLAQFLDTYVTNNPSPPAELAEVQHLYEAVDSVDSWRFMSQSLAGLGDLVALRDARAQAAPDASVASLVAGCTAGVPYMTPPQPPFQAFRQGQLAIQELLVYDTFGQVLQVVGGTGTTDPQNFAPARDAAVLPDKPVITRNAQRLVQLRPRLMQHARLDFSLADVATGAPVVPGSAANPVAAWLLPNHLDRGVLLYAPDGTALGEVRLAAGVTGARTAAWQPPPHSALTFADVAAAAPLLASVVGDAAFVSATAFETFLDVVDTTLWSVDPLGNRADQNLSVLVGRPLALVRARLQLLLDGLPVSDLSAWSTTWPPPAPDFTAYDLAVRLGDLAGRDDGLVGFFADGAYSAFNSVAAPDPGVAQSYVREIGPVGSTSGGNYPTLRFGDAAPAYVTLLLDPRASVHATTGILPVQDLTLPASFVDGPLSALELTFRIGSLLTHAEQSPSSGATPPAYPSAMWLPYPAERNGSWSWWERAAPAPASTWTACDLLRATSDARLKDDYPNTVRDGFLQLAADVGGDVPEGGTS